MTLQVTMEVTTDKVLRLQHALLRMNRQRNLDPTGTTQIRRQYEAEFVRRLKEVRWAVLEAVGQRDVMGLGERQSGLRTAVKKQLPLPQPRAFATGTTQARVDGFTAWLEDAVKRSLMSGQKKAGWLEPFVKRAYVKGALTATQALKKAGRVVRDWTVREILASPFHRQQMQQLYERNLMEIVGATDTMAQQIRREITDALLTGRHPNDTAKRLAKRIGVTETRARVIARTETIRTNADATLTMFENFGEREIRIKAEWVTAGDGRVCPQCSPLEGKVFTIERARGMIPVHPNCRCSFVPRQQRVRANVLVNFNPYHDSKGKFTTGPSAGGGTGGDVIEPSYSKSQKLLQQAFPDLYPTHVSKKGKAALEEQMGLSSLPEADRAPFLAAASAMSFIDPRLTREKLTVEVLQEVRMQGVDVVGKYDMTQRKLSLAADRKDARLVMHEYGHHIQMVALKDGARLNARGKKAYGDAEAEFVQAKRMGVTRAVSQYALASKHEWFAENWRQFFTNEAALKTVAPKSHALIRGVALGDLL